MTLRPAPQQPAAGQKTALITGSSRGLGLTLADFLAARGDALIITARDRVALDRAADALRRHGGPVCALPGDVNNAAHHRALAECADELGGLDLLVNNASVLGPSPLPALADYPLDALKRVYRTNVVAPLGLIQATLGALRARCGLIVNISSDAAVGAYPGWGGYGASKAALDLLSRMLAAELGGVGVVSVDPGDLRTQLHQAVFPGEDIADRPLPEVTLPFWAWLLGRDPLRVSGARFQAQGERWELPAGARKDD